MFNGKASNTKARIMPRTCVFSTNITRAAIRNLPMKPAKLAKRGKMQAKLIMSNISYF
jgi:hypothetical protein